ncbi:MAG: hypothetical protein AUJ92_05540 [Armatimonadetes bacterium CG2_30_59_28]|nr:hypothetical protein [Armatimonadota bacterium]OIO96648.1 MAG: hypothetical protein AUJ92_05540 [Armatimonadetes bacterium CG2_30_59_28]PIU63450.1 MAG: hypothetical protein COS85_16030 [Armatimonadetes bacterium CG07_land_8_20_14_0_80_59_28]PIY42510.1 MAG: hypothetical protein COZ05_13685 [Armatimonadetes bacterium CG_4_10_14_3_um_filter_59_10]
MKKWSRWIPIFVAAITCLALAGSVKQAKAAEYPQVAQLKAFSPEANFMSLPGYLRYLVFVQDGKWITRAEAVQIVEQQKQY